MPINGQPASLDNSSHFDVVAPDKAAVHDAFHAALEDGASNEGAPALALQRHA